MPNLDVLLIHPPVAKPGEPPAGLAQLKSALKTAQVSCEIIDANLEGLYSLIHSVTQAEHRRTRMALRNREKNIAALHSLETVQNFDNYKRSVLEINHLLGEAGNPYQTLITFTDYKQKEFVPVRSHDLIRAAEQPERNPFFKYFSSLLPRIEKLAPQVIGISLIYLSQAITSFALIGQLCRAFPHTKLVLGGGLITSWMSRPDWKNPFVGLVDEVIPGRGEKKLTALFHKAQKNNFHVPDYHNVEWDHYFSPGRVIPYATSYGCYWRSCTFCPECAEQNRFDPVPHDQVFDNLNTLAAHKPALFHFLDNALSPSLLKKIARRDMPAPWYGYARFTPELEDPDFCYALRQSGCVLLQLGLESGDQHVLDKMQKGIQLEAVSRILHHLKKAGIATFIYLLFGTPYETIAEARRTKQFVLDHADCINYINPALFNMPVFSDESERLSTRPFYEGDLSLYHSFDHPKGWHRDRVRHFLSDEFTSHSVIRKILNANPPLFTSNHAPFFTDFYKSVR
ncbi:radical SAM protein [candidate division KSB1 bacterium]|nr:radical SAM protein [candidate division KSB1 bacterium]